MQDFPLTVTGILRHGVGWKSERKVITATAEGYREISFGELGARVARLAHGLRDLGVVSGQPVATFMWNNQEHLEAYFAAPCMGAVLHTLNIRLAGEQIAFIANQAEDRVVLVDVSLAPLLSEVLAPERSLGMNGRAGNPGPGESPSEHTMEWMELRCANLLSCSGTRPLVRLSHFRAPAKEGGPERAPCPALRTGQWSPAAPRNLRAVPQREGPP